MLLRSLAFLIVIKNSSTPCASSRVFDMTEEKGKYQAENIKVLEGLEGVRHRSAIEDLRQNYDILEIKNRIKKMLKNLLTPQQAVENNLLLSKIFFNLQEQIVLEYSSQIFLSSTISIFILSK
ncbi:MAG: hypothetical protein AABX65_02140, partial [Nanoarchaeota archaeon]